MRRVVIVAGLVATVLAGCGDSASDETCGAIADDGIELIQELIDEIDALGPDELAAAASEPGFISDIEESAAALDEEAATAGCTEGQMRRLLDERAEDLSAESAVGQTIVDLVLEDAFFSSE